MNADRPLDRILRTLYPGHRRLLEPGYADFTQSLRRSAFPEFEGAVEFVFLRSSRRFSRRFREVGSNRVGTAVIDHGQVSLLGVQDWLLRHPRYEADAGLLLAMVSFAEAFRHEDALDRALACAWRCVERSDLLAALGRAAFAERGRSAIAIFLLLHELAHFVFDAEIPAAAALRSDGSEALEEHCRSNCDYAEAIANGAPLPEHVDFSASMPADRAILVRQMREHAALVLDSEEVRKEATCDLLAVHGFLRWRMSNPEQAGSEPPTLLEIGDIFVVGLRVSRLLMVDGFVRQYAGHIAAGSDPSGLRGPLSQLTARHNVVVNLLLAGFAARCAAFEEGGALSPLQAARASAAFRRDVEMVAMLSDDRLLRPIEKIGMFHLDEALWGEERTLIQRTVFPSSLFSRFDLLAEVDRRLSMIPF